MAGISLANLDIGGLFTGIGSLAKDIRAAITGKEPINAEKAAEIALQIQQLEASIVNAQMQVNLAEAGNTNVFVSGWRPFVGWTCGIALFYNYIFMPLFTYCAVWISTAAPAMPTLDSGELMTLLFGMLGLGGLRTYEKTKNVAL
jgi:hypothetical protein